MILKIMPIVSHGLSYYAVITVIGGYPSTLNTFMSQSGARDYVNRLRNSTPNAPSLFVEEM